MSPFFSIITVSYKDAWAFSKTARSVFRQNFDDFEYIVIDGESGDGTDSLARFWSDNRLVSKFICEKDGGVYEAMNKGIANACGRYICFLNSGDVFAHADVLAQVHEFLVSRDVDGCLGWGELKDQVWASWVEHEAFKLASLGFCHQALFVKKDLLETCLFDQRPFKTDSDTLQLGRLYQAGANIPIVPEVWSIRGGEPGISSNLERSGSSILDTLVTEYPELDVESAERILSFRRKCTDTQFIKAILEEAAVNLRTAVALMVLDTIFLRQSLALSEDEISDLVESALCVLRLNTDIDESAVVKRLTEAQALRKAYLESKASDSASLNANIVKFGDEERARLTKIGLEPNVEFENADFVVFLTSFPARISTLSFVLRSLVNQSCKPREIFLVLGSDEVPNKNWLPRSICELEEHGLQIEFVPKTCHQYDKYIHHSHYNRDQPYVIVDDDVIYQPNSIESLLRGHAACPDAIIGNRCHRMGVLENGGFAPYAEWRREVVDSKPSLALMPTGAGGVLYPAGFLCEETVTDQALILENAPYADDLWLKTCALAKGIPTLSTELSQGSRWYHRYTPTMRAGTLMAENVDLGLNDMQLAKCSDWLDANAPDWRARILSEVMEPA